MEQHVYYYRWLIKKWEVFDSFIFLAVRKKKISRLGRCSVGKSECCTSTRSWFLTLTTHITKPGRGYVPVISALEGGDSRSCELAGQSAGLVIKMSFNETLSQSNKVESDRKHDRKQNKTKASFLICLLCAHVLTHVCIATHYMHRQHPLKTTKCQ